MLYIVSLIHNLESRSRMSQYGPVAWAPKAWQNGHGSVYHFNFFLGSIYSLFPVQPRQNKIWGPVSFDRLWILNGNRQMGFCTRIFFFEPFHIIAAFCYYIYICIHTHVAFDTIRIDLTVELCYFFYFVLLLTLISYISIYRHIHLQMHI